MPSDKFSWSFVGWIAPWLAEDLHLVMVSSWKTSQSDSSVAPKFSLFRSCLSHPVRKGSTCSRCGQNSITTETELLLDGAKRGDLIATIWLLQIRREISAISTLIVAEMFHKPDIASPNLAKVTTISVSAPAGYHYSLFSR